MSQQILTADQMLSKVKRMAVEIYEHNFDATALSLVGISAQGYWLATMLQAELQSISPLAVQLVQLHLEKTARQQPTISLDAELESLAHRPLVLVDDVLNTGRTIWYALHPFSALNLPRVEVAVMVARNHSLYPIKPTYVGYGVSTTLGDHINIVMDDPATMGAYLV